jgi:hypothetical protein
MPGGTIMKPTNLAENGCKPQSSNCVIWQGPDIECLDLCQGDTISQVIFQLACLVCTLKDQLDVDTYDLTCLNLATCDIPHTFKDFMQTVIDKLCALTLLITPEEIEAAAETIITVASCFSGELGVTATISDYVTAIGLKVCAQDVTIGNQQTAITQLIARVDVLESLHP